LARGTITWKEAYVEDKVEESNLLKLRILSKVPGKRRDFQFSEDELILHPLSSVLSLIQPRILHKGTVFRVRSAEETAANAVFEKKVNC